MDYLGAPSTESGAVTTTSRVFAWWLQWKGLRVTGSRSVPTLGLFGQLKYKTTWMLEG